MGELSQSYDSITIEQVENQLIIKRINDSKPIKAKHGLYRALFFNMIEGVSKGWIKELELVGVGYRASNQGQKLELALGFSHNIVFQIPSEVKVETVSEKGKNPLIKLTPFPLYGSGFLKPLIFEAIEPTSCLSKEVNLIRGFLPFSDTVSTFTSDGI